MHPNLAPVTLTGDDGSAWECALTEVGMAAMPLEVAMLTSMGPLMAANTLREVARDELRRAGWDGAQAEANNFGQMRFTRL